MEWYKSPKLLRHAVMLFFFVLLARIAIEHQIKGGGPRGAPSVEAYCPFGGLETLYQFLTTGGFVRRIEPSSVILFFGLIILTLVASRGFCGWICPFGSLQEWIGMAGRKALGKRYNPTGRWDRGLRYLKYLVLAIIISLTWHTGSLVFRNYDPFLAFFHFGGAREELRWGYTALIVVLVGSLFIERVFCKYACPLGAVLALIGKAGLTRIQRDPVNCKECNLCQAKCHAHVAFLPGTSVRSAECNQCLDCLVDCPRPSVLSARAWRWRVSHPVFASLLVAGLLVPVYTSKLLGKWQTRATEVRFTNDAGKLDAQQIRGWMTLKDISIGYKIPLSELYAALHLPARVSPETPINRLKAEYEVNVTPQDVRDYVERRLVSAAATPRGGGGPGRKEKGAEDDARPEVRGFMTLNEIALQTGVPKQFLLQSLGLKAAEVDPRKPVREWLHEKGKTIQDLREAVRRYRAQDRH